MNRNESFDGLVSRVSRSAMAVLLLTTVHHVYGAVVYHTPWRLHAGFVSVFAAAAIVLSQQVLRRDSGPALRSAAFVVFVGTTAFIPVMVLARKYGAHADDQWPVDEVLRLAFIRNVTDGLRYDGPAKERMFVATTPPSEQDTPRLGIVRPPLVYLFALGVGALIQLAMPFPFIPGMLAVPLGAFVVAAAIALFSSAVAEFRAARTPVPARKPTTVIVRTGPYRVSRNPIYLAFSLFQLGIAICANSLWLVVTLAAAVAVIRYLVIPKEEQYLERRFGAEYLDYRRSVRRWL